MAGIVDKAMTQEDMEGFEGLVRAFLKRRLQEGEWNRDQIAVRAPNELPLQPSERGLEKINQREEPWLPPVEWQHHGKMLNVNRDKNSSLDLYVQPAMSNGKPKLRGGGLIWRMQF